MALLVTWSGLLWALSKSHFIGVRAWTEPFRYLLTVCDTTSREEFKLSLVLSQGSNVNSQNPPGMAELWF